MAHEDRGSLYDVVIIGGGPAGLSAALALGRGRKRVLLCDAGPPRNAAADQIHNFVTRDGTPPAEFRRIGREQLAPYPNVEVREVRVEAIRGSKGSFEVALASSSTAGVLASKAPHGSAPRARTEGAAVASRDVSSVQARRVVLCGGMIDELPALPGYRELWGKAIFQCPYCHGWEVRDRAFGCLATSEQWLDWALFLRGWTRDLVVFTDAKFAPSDAARARATAAGVRLEERAIERLVSSADGEHLEAIELEGGARVLREVLFARPPQRQTDLVRALELTLDEQGFVKTSEMMETSRPGVYAAGDLTTMMQGAVLAAGLGMRAAGALNHELTMELVAAGGPLP